MNSLRSRLASVAWGKVILFLFGTYLMVQNHRRYMRFLRTFGFWPPSKAVRTFTRERFPDLSKLDDVTKTVWQDYHAEGTENESDR